MGFNLRSAHHDVVLTNGEVYARLLRERFGEGVGLGRPGEEFCLPDELGWSWWSALQEWAKGEIGEAGCRHLCAVDAWLGVYVAGVREPVVLRVPGSSTKPLGERPRQVTVHGPISTSGGWMGRLLEVIGVRRRAPVIPPGVEGMMREMIKAFGTRESDAGGLQVAGLEAVFGEAEVLLSRIGCERTELAVNDLYRSYSESNERVDEDPHVQCLCHLWLTARHALERGRPMWLVK